MGPVLPKGARAAVVAINPKNSDVWPTLEIFRLTENMRAADDPEYGQFLERVGNGTLPTIQHEHLEDLIEMDERCLYPEGTTLEQAIDDMFPTQEELGSVERAFLCPTNKDVDSVNEAVMQKYNIFYSLVVV